MADINNLFQKAVHLQNKGRLRDAQKIYAKLYKTAPKFTQAVYMYGVVSAQLGEFSAASEKFKEALVLEPNHVHALEDLGKVYMQLRDFHQAKSCYEKALNLQPRSFGSLFGLAGALMSLNDFEQAYSLFKKAQKINQNQPSLYLNQGIVATQLKRFEEAEENYCRAISLDANFFVAHARLGNLYLQLEKYELAVKHLLLIDAHNVPSVENKLDLASALEHLGKFKQAYQCYLDAVKIEPQSQNAYTRFDQFLLSGSNEKREFLKYLGKNYVYSSWTEAVDDAKSLATIFNYHDKRVMTALHNFLESYSPGELYKRSWWQAEIDKFGDPAYGHDKVLRSVHSSIFCWSLPDSETMSQLAAFIGDTRLYSYGAGTGVWERLLSEHFDISVVATEYTLRHRFIPMTFEDYSTAKVNPNDTMFIAWIQGGDTNIFNIINQLQVGQKLILVGEPPDQYGVPRICATPELFALLKDAFRLEKTISLVSYSLLNDSVSMYVKK